MNGHVIVIGASAGGSEPLTTICRQLPADFPGSVFIVKHLPENSENYLQDILARDCNIPVAVPTSGEKILPGRIYLAPGGEHMTLEDGIICLNFGPKVNRARPAIDPLFRSAADSYNKKVIGIVLSGLLNDGTARMLAIKKRGGITIVQDPNEAEFSDMPSSVLKYVPTDYCMPSSKIAEVLVQLASKVQTDEEEAKIGNCSDTIHTESRMDIMANDNNGKGINDGSPENMGTIGSSSVFTCPDCHGTLWEVNDDRRLSFRCRVGHAFGMKNLALALDEGVEDALWAAMRSLEEKADLAQRIAERIENQGLEYADVFAEKATRAKLHKDMVQNILINLGNGLKT